jgi:2-methylcitrate dehydratase PrpD
MTDERHPYPVTEALIEFALRLDPRTLPEPVVDGATACLLDWMGNAIRGSREPLAEALWRVIAAAGGAPDATILGRGKKTSALWAVLANGAQSHALDFDDTHVPSLIHGSAPVAPVVLALAEWQSNSGGEALAAFVAGFEVEARIGRAIGHALAERGWHATGMVGTFGAAVAAGKLLGLDAHGLRQALGIAGTQAAGLEQSFGTMSKPFHPGKAAMNGLLAALLASEGFTGPTGILDGAGSFPRTFLGAANLTPALESLGERFELLENSFKPYAACLLTHATIDAGRAIRQRWSPVSKEVAAVECRVYPLTVKVAAIPLPRTGLEGKFSLPYCAALGLLEGEAGEQCFSDEAIRDPELRALTGKVRVVADASLAEAEAVMRVTLADGRIFEEHVKVARGNPGNPSSREELEEKFRALTGAVLPSDRVETLLSGIRSFPTLIDVGRLVALTAPPARRSTGTRKIGRRAINRRPRRV